MRKLSLVADIFCASCAGVAELPLFDAPTISGCDEKIKA